MGDMTRAVAVALRRLARTPLVTGAGILTMGLGVGAAALVFTLLRSVLLTPPPFPEPDELVAVRETRGGVEGDVAPANYLDWRRNARTFEALAAYRGTTPNLLSGERPTRVSAADVSGNFFATLGVSAVLGRTFDPDLRLDDARRVVVVSHGLWRETLGGDPDVVGRTLRLDDLTYEIVGVAPEGFSWPHGARLWTRSPWEAPEIRAVGDALPDLRDAWYFDVVGRLAEGVSLITAAGEMNALAATLAREHPVTNGDRGVALTALHQATVSDARPTLLLLMGAVGLVLLVACVNLATLMLVRSAGRARQLTVQSALGAGRIRLAAEAFLESGLIAALGGGGGVLAAWAGLAAIQGSLPVSVTAGRPVEMDGGALLFALFATAATGLAFGAAPAVGAARTTPRSALTTRSGDAGRRTRRAHGALIGIEVALAVVLVTGATLLLRSLGELTAVDPGFRPGGLVSLGVAFPDAADRSADASRVLYGQLLEEAGSVPGVESAALALRAPVSVGPRAGLNVESAPAEPSEWPDVGWTPVTPGVFRTLGTPLLRGRGFTDADGPDAEWVGVVNETLARTLFPGGDVLGQRVSIGLDGHDRWITLVGVVSDTRNEGPATPATPVLFRPLDQVERFPVQSLVLLARVEGGPASHAGRGAPDPGAVIPALRDAVFRAAPGAPVYGEATGDDMLSAFTARHRLVLSVLGAFATVALLLGVVGIYGVTAHAVGARRREIGVRMAVGAGRGRVVATLVAEGLRVVGVGTALGLASSVAAGRALSGFLFGVSPWDPATLAGVSAVLVLTAAAALAVPARRAATIHPAEVLKGE